MWRLWKCRNNMVFNRKADTPVDTINRAMEDTKEWLDSREENGKFPSQRDIGGPRQNLTWQKPRSGWVKCNFDASHHEGNRSSGLGWIIRNSDGTFLFCDMETFQGRHRVEEAENNTLIWALQAAWRLGYRRVEFEGDNSNLINAVNTNSNNLRLIFEKYVSGDIILIQSRDCNACADHLARKCLWVLYNLCPSFLTSLVNRDNVFAN
ncbi:hypothetical protein V5N11_020712 [Cardamine amara subsp. amara]|uniref:RNase H type-1 domain-containing protein n=1 Tax=Cardamine amara subsp. amara TaxID=228776 RepID=A0ABD1BZ45_CARAN